jgi:hypothetical protein
MRFCSDSATSACPEIFQRDSWATMAPNAQSALHCCWSLTGVTEPEAHQSTEEGARRAKSRDGWERTRGVRAEEDSVFRGSEA